MTDQPKKRGGSKKGRTFMRVKRDPNEGFGTRYFRLSDTHFKALHRIGAGDATAGLRRLIDAQLLVEGALDPSEQ